MPAVKEFRATATVTVGHNYNEAGIRIVDLLQDSIRV